MNTFNLINYFTSALELMILVCLSVVSSITEQLMAPIVMKPGGVGVAWAINIWSSSDLRGGYTNYILLMDKDMAKVCTLKVPF